MTEPLLERTASIIRQAGNVSADRSLSEQKWLPVIVEAREGQSRGELRLADVLQSLLFPQRRELALFARRHVRFVARLRCRIERNDFVPAWPSIQRTSTERAPVLRPLPRESRRLCGPIESCGTVIVSPK